MKAIFKAEELESPYKHRKITKKLRSGYNKISEEALKQLEQLYEESPYPDVVKVETIAKQFNYTKAKVQNWFKQKRRYSMKKGSAFTQKTLWFYGKQLSLLQSVFQTLKYPNQLQYEKLSEQTGAKIKHIKNWFIHQRQKEFKVNGDNYAKEISIEQCKHNNFLEIAKEPAKQTPMPTQQQQIAPLYPNPAGVPLMNYNSIQNYFKMLQVYHNQQIKQNYQKYIMYQTQQQQHPLINYQMLETSQFIKREQETDSEKQQLQFQQAQNQLNNTNSEDKLALILKQLKLNVTEQQKQLNQNVLLLQLLSSHQLIKQ